MYITQGKLVEVINSPDRIVVLETDYSKEKVVARVLFSPMDLEIGDDFLIFIQDPENYTETVAIPFTIKNRQSLDNVKIFFGENYLDINKERILAKSNRHSSISISKDKISIYKNEFDGEQSNRKGELDGEEIPRALIEIDNDKVIIKKTYNVERKSGVDEYYKKIYDIEDWEHMNEYGNLLMQHKMNNKNNTGNNTKTEGTSFDNEKLESNLIVKDSIISFDIIDRDNYRSSIYVTLDGIFLLKYDPSNVEKSRVFVGEDSIRINKSNNDKPVSEIIVSDDNIILFKGDKQGVESNVISVSDKEISIRKSPAGMSVNEIYLDDKFIQINGRAVHVPGTPQIKPMPTGGFSQIAICPFTGLPHTTDTLYNIQ